MKFRATKFFFKEAFSSFSRNIWMVLASIAVVAVSLVIFGVSLLMVTNAYSVTGNVESDVAITVYLKDNLSQTEVKSLAKDFKEIDGVQEVTFVSKDKALAEFRKTMKDKKEVLDALEGGNPLPDQYEVKAAKANEVATVAKKLEVIDGVDKVNYGQDIVQTLFSIFKWVRWIGYSAMILLGLAATFLISTTIQLTLYARRKEIRIMKLVGATDWFIRWPYILEGVFIGFAGALFSSLILFIAYSFVVLKVNPSMPLEMQLKSGFGYEGGIFGIIALVGIIIGAAGSLISIRKYLRV